MCVCVQRVSVIWSARSVIIAVRHPVSVRVNPASPVSRVAAVQSAISRVGRQSRRVSVSVSLSVSLLLCLPVCLDVCLGIGHSPSILVTFSSDIFPRLPLL